jgi:dipeptidyl aminopeptidase/acylaminoacyl peptidase
MPNPPAFAPYLRIRGCGSPHFSPDGSRIAFITNTTGTTELWSVPASGGWPQQLSFGAERIWGATYSPGPDVAVMARDRGGNERNQLIAVPGGGGPERALTNLPEVIHHIGAWSPDGKRLAFSANREHPVDFTVYIQDLDGTGEATAVWRASGQHRVADWSADGRRLLITHSNSPSDQDLHVLDLTNGQSHQANPHTPDATFQAAAFLDGAGQEIICLSDEGREFAGVLRIGPDGGRTWLLTPEHDIEALALSPDRTRICYAVNDDGTSRLRLYDLRRGEDRELAGVPAGVLTAGPVWSPDGTRIAASLSRATRPEAIWVADLAAGSAREIAPPTLAGIDPASFVAPEHVSYPSFDGRRIPALYYRPRGAPGPLPVIVSVHGGPEGQERGGFNAVYQYFLSRGYAIFAPNVRGSTGYGRTYEHLDDRFKRMDAVTDMAHGVAWLKAEGGADPRRIAVYGASYGGFMVMAGITHHPDLWAAAIDIVGIVNLETLLENTHPTRRYLREAEYGFLATDREFFRQIAPINHADRIRAPLLVIHGKNDPRVPHEEAEQIVGFLRARNRPVEFLSFDNEGHGVARLENRLVAYPAIADFLDRYMGAGA